MLSDMADLRSMKKHEMFLSLKRDLALVSVLRFIYLFILRLQLLSLIIIYIYIYIFKGCPSCAQGQGVGEQFPLINEG